MPLYEKLFKLNSMFFLKHLNDIFSFSPQSQWIHIGSTNVSLARQRMHAFSTLALRNFAPSERIKICSFICITNSINQI